MKRKIERGVIWVGAAPPMPAAIPEGVEAVARSIGGEDLLGLIRENWPFLEMLAESDRFFGQKGRIDSPAYREALAGLTAFLRWAGPSGEHVRGLAGNEAIMDEANGEDIFQRLFSTQAGDSARQVALDVEAVKRLEALLTRHSKGSVPKKAKKGLLPVLAQFVCEWHAELGLPAPARSYNAPGVKLMRAIAGALRVEVSGDAHRKALATALDT